MQFFEDSVALAMIIFEFFARQDGESSEAWVDSANQAIAGGIDGVLNLMHRLPGNAGVQQPVAIRRFAALINDLLKQNSKAGILESLCSKALTLHVLSPDHELSVHDGSGVVMKGKTLREILNGDTLTRDDDCGKLASIQHTLTPRVILKRENDFGIGVQIDEDLGKGKLAGFYAGGFHASMSDQKPTRMCARQSAKQYCDGGDEKLAYEWLFGNSVTGPLMNAATKEANCCLDRYNYFVDSNGIIWFPMYSTRPIKKGEFLVWNYTHDYSSMHAFKDSPFNEQSITEVP